MLNEGLLAARSKSQAKASRLLDGDLNIITISVSALGAHRRHRGLAGVARLQRTHDSGHLDSPGGEI